MADDDAAREAYEQGLTQLENLDDPLAVYDTYICHLQRSLSQLIDANQYQARSLKKRRTSDINSILLSVLTASTQKFLDDWRYKQDPRWARHWIAYAEKCKDADAVFLFMRDNGICSKVAVMWESWAKLHPPYTLTTKNKLLLSSILTQKLTF